MKLKLSAIILLFLGVTSIISCSFISNNKDENSWKQFRGNYRNGSSFDEGSFKEVTSIEPSLKWKQALGSGFSEILISEDKVFTMMSEKIDSTCGLEYVVAFDASSGKQLWKTVVDSMLVDPEGSGEGPRSTPAMDSKAIYSLSTYGYLTAISREDGKKLWVLNFLKEFENKPGWIYTSSPLLMGDEILIEVGGSKSRGFASINKKTGTVNWITGEGVSTYSSPSPAMIDDKQQVVFANGSTLKSFDQEGNQLWSYDMPFQGAIATPLFIAPNNIFVSYGGGCFMVEIKNNIATEVFSNKSMRNTFSTSCYYGGHIYGISGGVLKCISATNGEIKWSEGGFGLGSLIIAENKLLTLTANGELKIVEASPAAYNELKSFQAIEGKSWTAPSFAKGRLYLRNLTEMASYRLYD